ncbi:pca operon transcription factor PcaQ [Modicisalibacter tunisiensis]|uniref:pca operon transcription factor PcaQ n=1 Tax=Modicisalibacter tunisiensis TaxID=390637 RepID=UPI001CCBFF1E|nr:pca operon transcription factor PcaQ [Modicisalibacter tunisiensis]MBZ9540310.1 pca operon transcription factor PcaQ [Modicisalibacter tunisiensis]
MLNPRIKLRHLQAFLELAKRRSFVRAAESLAITQPALSKTIRELEDNLGASLFDRTPQGVSLNQAGLTLLRHAGPALRALEEGITAIGDGHGRERRVRVGALSTVESRFLPLAIERLHGRHTDIGVRVVDGPSAYLLSRLRAGELDLVVGRMTEAREIRDLTFEHLYYEPLVVVVRAGHALSSSRTPPLQRLGEFPWVLPPPQTTLRQQVDSFCVRHALVLPGRVLETLSLAVSRRYVLDSDALWVAPREAVSEDVAAGRLAVLEVGLERQGGSVGLCINASLRPSLALEAFCEMLREVAAAYR